MADEVQDLIREILERVVRVETKIDGYNGLREKLDKTHGMACSTEKRVDKIEDDQKWLWRTIAGCIITAVVVAAIKFV